MNVKKGDLAVITKSRAGNEGRIVEVVSILGERPWMYGAFWCGGEGVCWLVRSTGSPMMSEKGLVLMEQPFPDAWLRPVSGLPVEEYDRIMEQEPA